MKYSMSREKWEKIGRDTGWIKTISYNLNDTNGPLCQRCGVKPAGRIDDEEGNLLGYGDYCEECDNKMDNGPFVRLLNEYGPEKALQILDEKGIHINPKYPKKPKKPKKPEDIQDDDFGLPF